MDPALAAGAPPKSVIDHLQVQGLESLLAGVRATGTISAFSVFCVHSAAMAEGALTHALSTATGTAMAALGNVTTSDDQPRRRPPRPADIYRSSQIQDSDDCCGRAGTAVLNISRNRRTSSRRVLIASIQGAAPQRVRFIDKRSQNKPTDLPKPTLAPRRTDSHPSEITCPAPK
jgi:hypothetical protein